MAPPYSRKAHPGALSANDEPRGDLAGERDHLPESTSESRPQGLKRSWADAPRRRPETLDKLRAGCEFVELLDRRRPCWQAGRCRR